MILPFDQRPVGLVVGIALVALGLAAADPRPQAQQFTARTDLVEVYATVTDEEGRFVTDLERGEFTILEDGVPQTVTAYAAGNQPVAIALAVDRSWSMAGERLEAARRGGRELLLELDEQDRSMLVAIGSDVDVPVPLTADRRAVDDALQALDAWGSTALHDAVITAFDAIEPAPGRRALVLVSDGVERHSRRTVEDVLARVRASDVLAYPVVLQRTVPATLERLATMTGGRAVRVRQLRDVPSTLRRIASELRHQYLLGYEPTRPPTAGEYRRIEVKVARAKHVVRARTGYIAR